MPHVVMLPPGWEKLDNQALKELLVAQNEMINIMLDVCQYMADNVEGEAKGMALDAIAAIVQGLP